MLRSVTFARLVCLAECVEVLQLKSTDEICYANDFVGLVSRGLFMREDPSSYEYLIT